MREIFAEIGDWNQIALKAKVGHHDYCQFTDAAQQRACCKMLMQDALDHARRIDDLEKEGSIQSLIEAMREFAEEVDARSRLCRDCGGVDIVQESRLCE